MLNLSKHLLRDIQLTLTTYSRSIQIQSISHTAKVDSVIIFNTLEHLVLEYVYKL